MAYSKITTNKRGVLQAKIQAYGLDPMTGKSKLYVKTVHSTVRTKVKINKTASKDFIFYCLSSGVCSTSQRR